MTERFLTHVQEKRPKIEVALRGNLITWWVYRMSYVAALCFVKLSILWFYRAIASHRTFRRYVNATIAFVCMYSFAAIVASALQCENPSNSWSTAGYLAQFDRDPNTKRPKVKCFDPIKLWVFCAAANLLSDVVIMLLPIPALLSLRVPMSKRLALIGIFSIGIMAIIASSVRMWVMFLWAESPWNSGEHTVQLTHETHTDSPGSSIWHRPTSLGPSRNKQWHHLRIGPLLTHAIRKQEEGRARRDATKSGSQPSEAHGCRSRQPEPAAREAARG